MSSSIVVRIIRETDDGNIVNSNGQTCTLRQYPFSIDTYSLSALSNENGCYHTSISASDLYKLYVNGVEEKSFGGDNGIYLSSENNNGWYWDRINSVRLSLSSDNVIIGSNISDSHKLAILGDTSITGNLYVSGVITNPALSSLTANINLTPYTLTSTFVSSTSNLSSRINSVSSSQTTISSNLNSLSSTVNSLTGATLLSKTSSQIYLTNSSDSLRLGNSTGVTAMKLEVQGQALIGNTTYYGASAEKGRISWGGVPQCFNFYALSTLNASIGTNAGEILTVASGGNVGVNISTPNKQLSVNGETSITGGLTAFGNAAITGALVVGNNLGNRLYTQGVINNGAIVSTNNGSLLSTSGNYAVYLFNLNETGIGICGTLDAFNYDNPSVNTPLRIGHSVSFIDFGVGGNAVPKMRLDTNGNLSIGTGSTTSNNRLNLLGNASVTGNLSLTGATTLTGGLTVKSDGTNSIVSFQSGNGTQQMGIRNNGLMDFGAGIVDFSSGYKFSTGITQRFSIESNGRVGVGTSVVPNEIFSVSGNISSTGGIITAQITTNSLTGNIIQSGQTVTYNKGANHIIAYNDAGTIKYRYLVLTGTDANWIYSTTAP